MVKEYIVSQVDDDYLITIKGYSKLLKFLNFTDFSTQKSRDWLKAGKIAGVYYDNTYLYRVNKEVYHICFGQPKGYDCTVKNCKYKDAVKGIQSLTGICLGKGD